MPTPADWERAYHVGRHEELWDTPWPSPELAGLLVAMPVRGRVDDLGCGTGSDLILLAQRGLRALGVDLSGLKRSASPAAKAREAGVWVDAARTVRSSAGRNRDRSASGSSASGERRMQRARAAHRSTSARHA